MEILLHDLLNSLQAIITALCTVGRPCLSDPSIGAATMKSFEQNQTLVVVAVSVNDAKLNRGILRLNNFSIVGHFSSGLCSTTVNEQ